MKIIKRNGSEVPFDINKISGAIAKANAEVAEADRLTDRQIMYASANVADECEAAGHTVSVEEIQDMVEDEIMRLDRFEVARKYIIYRYLQNQKRHKNT
ncbi:MAG TPA: anaerobic ribonucleoside-triphosphate reductase, partial [Eggerthellaceae bacterium]|nr:anaerobic ribonucleoside-triphosphate reductase [Eggerthellaceae bacterium]